ncbi:phosphoglucosamine mutase [Heliorestis acidaminivorans]|uniref:Phosphoglucosamine mutase n=1 Tax=Heliorestis acidaminivorans TaxID=553427 RepID=A0A6I0EYI3_9FIRM|nr:phosphoglucosamine mutase [Heliorestis acidaminivorans]KAB2953471.1 phosphoglucosamine mutase [Heliorestis acidaminivorans]
MSKLFGTDGVRGVANRELTPELAFRLGRAGAYVLGKHVEKPKILIGKDTRISGDMLEAALIAGITSVGADVLKVGILPTPGIAFLTKELEATAGVVISASHNPVEDNGIKFVGSNGYKLSDALEEEIEKHCQGNSIPSPIGTDIGRVYEIGDAENRYLNFLLGTIQGNLTGLKVVLDGANGAASQIAPKLFVKLGAEVVELHCQPDGTNINKACGSTHPEDLRQAVIDHQAHVGLAFDGDADRLIAVDEKGQIVDGDQIMVACALHMQEKKELVKNIVVVTVMSNLGLHLALKKAGIQIVETKVGDRYVLEALQQEGAIFGGEQSGHILFLQHNTTGDGLLTGLQLLSVIQERNLPLSALAGQMDKLPQLLVNVRVKDKCCMEEPAVQKAIDEGKKKLEGRGRILVRPSGTEPLIRVMGEGPDKEELTTIVEGIANVFRQYC